MSRTESDRPCSRRDNGTIARERLASAGRPTPLCTVAITSADGRSYRPGERGEIVVCGSLVMARYSKNPEATREASAHGWHYTGDIGSLDDEGFLFIVDRGKDMIITGGFNVYSAEVEQALMAYAPVQDGAVVGVRTKNGASASSPSFERARGRPSIPPPSSRS